MRFRGGTLALLGLLLLALAVACTSGQADPHATLPASSASMASSAPAPSSSPPSSRPTGPKTTGPNVRPGERPPTLNAYARQHTSAGALSFARYYYEALDWSFATTDPYLLIPISAPTCQVCKSHISSINRLRARGGRIAEARISVDSARLVERTEKLPSDYVIALTSSQQRVVLVGADGSRSVAAPASTGTSFVLVSWISGHWAVAEESAN